MILATAALVVGLVVGLAQTPWAADLLPDGPARGERVAADGGAMPSRPDGDFGPREQPGGIAGALPIFKNIAVIGVIVGVLQMSTRLVAGMKRFPRARPS
jgi:hypothetical protein